jgi:TfoX/Sxy family transcriptional regulator of competence genes
MSYDEKLAMRVRKTLELRDDVVERKMFGGLCFMVGGAMCCGIAKNDFMVRVGPAQYDDALAQPHARPMDFTGRPLKGMVYVAPEGIRTAAALGRWVRRGLAFLATTPAVKARKRTSKRLAKLIRPPRVARERR